MKNVVKKFWQNITKNKKRNNMGGADISGVWYNPKTGQKVIAKQMISDGNEMIVQTDQGMISMNEFSSFVQMGDDIYDESGTKIGNETANISEVFSDYNIQQEQNRDLLNKPLVSSKPKKKEEIKSTIEIEEEPTKDINEEILDRAFAKIEGTPRITNIEIDWDGLPLEKIKSMIELMDLSVADVSKYILKKYFKTTNIIENKITKELI